MPSKKRLIEMQYGKPLEAVLLELFSKYKSQRALARKLGVSQGTISLWMKSLKLQIVTEIRLVKRQ